MELRSCSHLHFIQAVKGGLLIKALNVARGRPVLKFKKLADIHETLDAKNGDLCPTIPPKDEFRGSLLDSHRGMGESTSNSTVRKIRIKSEPEDSGFDTSNSSGGGNMDLDGFSNMTLKQMKETCKKKKRKRLISVDLDKEHEKCSPVKQEYSELQTDDLMEPLSNWKFKPSKKAKAKTKGKRMKSGASTMSRNAISILIIKSEHVSSEAKFEDVPASGLNIKLEVPEADSLDFQNKTCFVGDTSLASDNQVGSRGVVPNELPATAVDCVSSIGLPFSQTEESQPCFVDEAYNECMEYEPTPIQIINEFPVTAADCVSSIGLPFSQTEESQPCYVDEAYNECMEYEPTPIQIITTSDWDIVEVDDEELTGYQCLDFPLLEYNVDGYMTGSVHPDIFLEAISSAEGHSFDMHDTIASEDEELCQLNTQVQMSDMAADDLLQFPEPVNGSDACPSEADREDDLASNLEASASSGNERGFDSGTGLVSVDSHMAEVEKQSKMFPCGAERNLSPGIFVSNATDELKALPSGGSPDLKQQCPPHRLFQNRKIISPGSQEKLCKALKSIELQDEHRACKRNLCFGNQTAGTIGVAEGPDQIKRAKFSTKPPNTRNPKKEKTLSHPKGIPKASKASPTAPRFSTGCTSIRVCSESAIAFSQRQMHDIELLATKLTNELQTMKEIAEERLHSEAFPATSLKYNANEVRMAIKNVTRVEESSRRLLNMMTRDCSRFCKIMKLADNDPNASENVANKEGKKITFADEAGEKLCHVKFFQNDMAPVSETAADSKAGMPGLGFRV